MRLRIKESYELTEANRPNVFDYKKDRAFGDVIDPNEKVGNVSLKDYYKFEKGKDAIISWMTGDEYIDKCIDYIMNFIKNNKILLKTLLNITIVI
jgi:hypothetical protein